MLFGHLDINFPLTETIFDRIEQMGIFQEVP